MLRTARALDPAALAEPSLLPGWTRGHVLSHLARNADAYTGVLVGVLVGVPIPGYPSRAHRVAGIEAGAGNPPEEHLRDLAESAARLADVMAAMDQDAWDAEVRWHNGMLTPASWTVRSRLREVEIHHVDLDAGYRTADWPEPFVRWLLDDLAADVGARPGVPPVILLAEDLGRELSLRPADAASGRDAGLPVVSGPGHALCGWLAGRGAGAGLTVSTGRLPELPTWL